MVMSQVPPNKGTPPRKTPTPGPVPAVRPVVQKALAQAKPAVKPAAVAARPVIASKPAEPKKAPAAESKVAPAVLKSSSTMPAVMVKAAPARKMSVKMIGIAAAAVLMLTCVVAYAMSSGRNDREAFRAAAKSTAVVAPGLVEPESGLLKMSFDISGKLKTVGVEEGQAVKIGQVIAELESSDIAARLESARAACRLAEAQLKTEEADLETETQRAQLAADRCRAELALLKAGARPEEIARAKSDVDAANADSQRAADDAAKYNEASSIQSGAWSQQQRDNARRLAESAAAKLKGFQETLRVIEAGARPEEIQKAEAIYNSAEADARHMKATKQSRLEAAKAQVCDAQAKVKLAESELDKSMLRSPFNGAVVWKYKHGGESVGILPPDPVVAVADCSRLRVRVDVDEADFGRISVGQKVKVTADAYPDREFAGTVTSISNAAGQKRFSTGDAKEKNDVKVVETLIRLDEKCPLKIGLRVTAWFGDAAKK